MADTAICWLRNDLRFHDNETLVSALEAHARVLLVYTLDLRLFERLPNLSFRKTGVHRAAFLLECLEDLRQRARSKGGEVAVVPTSAPAAALKKLAEEIGAKTIYAQAEIASEETTDEAAVAAAMAESGGELKLTYGKSLYHREDVPFEALETPEPFRNFRKQVEKLPVRSMVEEPTRLTGPENFTYPPTPSLADLGFKEEGSPAYPGGETAGLKRLAYYLEETHLVMKYRSTRNRSLGPDYSTKFSPYLAIGALSPRMVYHRIKDYQQQTGKRYVGNNILFEMRWRDYFLFLGVKHGDGIFRPGGLKNRPHDWSTNESLFERWCLGQTGLPFVDAHMRELAATGFMSNRGRVNCSSFLTRDYEIDWRWGAAWFENKLIDYEVCANWFNWHTQALEIYYTSPPWQGLKYDKKGEYVKTWLPELADLPAPLVHAPWKMEEEGMLDGLEFDLDQDYYRPGISNSKWDWAWTRLKTGDASSPKRRKKKS
ncbi:hypothetical protein A3850_016580 [Lewinella sp. 4G2]|nr:hypothetical protein A3850_016580 [Lewinella sp. 4G2]